MAATSLAMQFPADRGGSATAAKGAGAERPTSAVGRAGANGPLLHRRVCALATAVSCAAHLWWAAMGTHGLWLGLLMVGLAAVCVPCALHVWRCGSVPALRRVVASALLMAAVHAGLLLGAGGAGHAHGGVPPPSVVPAAMQYTSGSVQLLQVISLELSTALLAATLMARLRREDARVR